MAANLPPLRRQIGLFILNLAGTLVMVGALYDLLVPSVPPNHLSFIGHVEPNAGARLAELDLAMLRSVGGCLLAIGITCLALVNGPVRHGDGWARAAVLVLIGVAESNNAYRMYPFGSPWYGPLTFALLAMIGVALVGKSRADADGSRTLAK
jgi:hypothetical protein